MKTTQHHYTGRRKFLRTAACAAIGSASFYSSIFNLQAMSNFSSMNRVSGGKDDYKALVCLMLRGGNDGFNTLVPYDDLHYSEYAQSRSDLAIDRGKLIPIFPKRFNDKELALHPSTGPLKDLFDDEKLAFISNIGTLVRPTSLQDVQNNTSLPTGLFSHSDQAHHWQTSVPQTNSPTGWAGRLADIVRDANSNQDISMNISLAGKNSFQLGRETSEYSILPLGDGSIGIKGFNGSSHFDMVRTAMVKSLMEKQYQDVFKQSYAHVVTASQNAHELFSGALSGSELDTEFSDKSLSQDLKMVARTIKVRESLGVSRQTFYIQMEGWDHHDDLLDLHEDMLEELGNGLKEFQYAMAELGLEDKVTLFTISDFGRTLNSNGEGSDHAWGSNAMVLGGQVRGKEVYGQYPSLGAANSRVLDGGILIPDISTDEYFAELALWFGVSRMQLLDIFPNLSEFYNSFSTEPPIGFMDLS